MGKPFATGLGDINDLALRRILGNQCYGKAIAATGTTKSKVKTTAAIDYTIDGVFYTKAATDDLFVHTDLTVQAVGTSKFYALCLDKDGAASVIAGATQQVVDGISYPLAVSLPPIPATKTCVAVLKIDTDATHTFTPATTLNDAAGITATYFDIAMVPAAGYPA